MIFFSPLPGSSVARLLDEQEGVRQIGRNYFAQACELEESVTANFFINAVSETNGCLAEHQFHKWDGIANALRSDGRTSDILFASRVAAQIRICRFRLERLSVAYRTVLINAGGLASSQTNVRFRADKFAQYIGSEFRSILNEMYGLRDALLSAAHRLMFRRDDPFTIKKIKALCSIGDTEASRLIFDSMFADEPIGIIYKMSLYRIVALHCTGSTNPILGDLYQVRISRGPLGELPFLVYPLYDDIQTMRAIERGSTIERSNQEEAKRFLGLTSHQDGLEFALDSFVCLLRIAELVSNAIGVVSIPFKITDNEIIEATFTDSNGSITRIRRNSESGKLEEY